MKRTGLEELAVNGQHAGEQVVAAVLHARRAVLPRPRHRARRVGVHRRLHALLIEVAVHLIVDAGVVTFAVACSCFMVTRGDSDTLRRAAWSSECTWQAQLRRREASHAVCSKFTSTRATRGRRCAGGWREPQAVSLGTPELLLWWLWCVSSRPSPRRPSARNSAWPPATARAGTHTSA